MNDQATETLTDLTTQVGARTLELNALNTKLAETREAETEAAGRLAAIQGTIATIQGGLGKAPIQPRPVETRNWVAHASDFVAGLEKERTADKKKFAVDGPAKTRAAMATLDSFRVRLQKLA